MLHQPGTPGNRWSATWDHDLAENEKGGPRAASPNRADGATICLQNDHRTIGHRMQPTSAMEGPMVYIQAYYRIRLGRVEHVRAHFRSQ